MGYIKKQILELSKAAGSKTMARRESEKWFEESKKSIRERAVIKTRQRFLPGKIYVFRYEDPVGKNTLKWWDLNPVVLALDPYNNTDLGINMNLLPIQVKEQLLDFVYERMKGQIKNKTMGPASENAIAQGHISLTYSGASNFLKRYGYDFAIRRYIPSRKKNQAVVSYENWARIALCDFIDINGSTPGAIKAQFRNHLNK